MPRPHGKIHKPQLMQPRTPRPGLRSIRCWRRTRRPALRKRRVRIPAPLS